MNWRRHGASWMAALIAGLLVASCVDERQAPVLQPGNESWFLQSAMDALGPAGCDGLTIAGIDVQGAEVRIRLMHPDGPGRVTLVHPDRPCPNCPTTRDFRLDPDGSRCARAFAGALARVLDDPSPREVWRQVDDSRVGGPLAIRKAQVARWANAGAVRFGFLGLWLALFGMVAVLGRRQATPELLLLFAGGWGLRLALATWGPGDLQMNLLDPMARVYGLAGPALARPLVDLFEPRDPVPLVVGIASFLGAVVPVVLVLALREAGFARRVALIGGVLLALHPVAVRFSGDCERQMYVLFAQVAAFLSVAAAHTRGRWWPLVGFVLGGVLALNSRPEGGLVWAAGGILALLFPWSRRTLGTLVIAGIGVAWTAWHMTQAFPFQVQGLATPMREWRGFILIDTDFTPLMAMLLFVAGAWMAVQRRHRMLLGLVLLTLVSVSPGYLHSTADLQIASARYQLQALAPFAAVAAFGMAGLEEGQARRWSGWRSWWPGLVLWTLLIASAAAPMARVTRPVTIDHEFAFLRRVLPDLPNGAVVFVAHPDGRIGDNAGFRSAAGLAGLLGRQDITWRLWGEPTDRLDAPRFFYRQPACAMPPSLPCPGSDRPCPEDLAAPVLERCRAGMEAVHPQPVAQATIPAIRYSYDRYRSDQVSIGFYRVATGNH